MKMTETHLSMIKRYCEIHAIDYHYQVGVSEQGENEPCVSIENDDVFEDGIGLFVLGYDNNQSETDYLNKIEAYFLKQGDAMNITHEKVTEKVCVIESLVYSEENKYIMNEEDMTTPKHREKFAAYILYLKRIADQRMIDFLTGAIKH